MPEAFNRPPIFGLLQRREDAAVAGMGYRYQISRALVVFVSGKSIGIVVCLFFGSRYEANTSFRSPSFGRNERSCVCLIVENSTDGVFLVVLFIFTTASDENVTINCSLSACLSLCFLQGQIL